MNPKYAGWIERNCTGVLSGFCRSLAEDMQKAFPELVLCRGWYSSPVDGARSHWWLKTSSGEIVDPTASQFKMGAAGSYEEYDEALHGALPIGKCMNCGNMVYEEDGAPASCCCSKACELALDGYYNGVPKGAS